MSLEIYVASAGTGKTGTLARLLEEALLGKGGISPCRPEGVLATTFTRQAAAELRERARVQLLSNGCFDAAQQLNAALIGSVNSVCGRIISDFALELGLSPDVRVLDEIEAATAMEEVLSHVCTPAEQEEIFVLARTTTELTERESPLQWFESVRKIVDLARTNGIDAAALHVSKDRSIAALMTMFGPVQADGDAINRELASALKRFLDSVDINKHKANKTQEAVGAAHDVLDLLDKSWRVPWHQWVKLANLDAGAKLRDEAGWVQEAAAKHDNHPLLRTELSRAVTLIFDIAKRALSKYDQHKRKRGAIDFVDQELIALQALENPTIRDELRRRIDLVLVDEFQDTSPLQLAIFLKLAEIAPRSIWVGDQKQAIYSFRGTDPALMKAAIDELEEDGHTELLDKTLQQLTLRAKVDTLGKSWRSRPSLVRLTSKVFGAAFEQHDIPRTRVEIEPGVTHDDPALGPVIEHWRLQIANAAATRQLPHSVATGVRALLEEDATQVRDRASSQTRPIAASDVGILCRTNGQCQDMAAALTALGINAQVPRTGVFSTPEGRVLLAALNLWYEPTASLPKAELSRLLGATMDPAQWLNDILAPQMTFDTEPAVQALLRARQAAPHSDVLNCFDQALEAVALRERCMAWGDASQRLSNLDAMRAHAECYVEMAQTSGSAATLIGLLRHITDVIGHDADVWGHASERNAVTVTTWHAAKGLEWPIVILFGLEQARDRPLRTLGARAETPEGPVDLTDVLKGRWIRFWTTPYRGANTKTPFYDRLTQHPLAVNAKAQQEREELRLLYVGWTRARDRLVLATHDHGDKFNAGMLRHLSTSAGPLVQPFDSEQVTWASVSVVGRSRELTFEAPVKKTPMASEGYMYPGPSQYPAAYALPSALVGICKLGAPVVIAPGIVLRGSFDIRHMGQALHAFLAADDPEYPFNERERMACEVARSWGVLDNVDPPSFIGASNGLRTWAHQIWTVKSWLREVPMRMLNDNNTCVHGRADLVIETAQGYVVVDHKLSLGAHAKEAEQRAMNYGGQLNAYRQIIQAATGKPALGCYVFVPLSGTVLEVLPA